MTIKSTFRIEQPWGDARLKIGDTYIGCVRKEIADNLMALQVAAAAAEAWTPISTPPPMTLNEMGWLSSPVVLVYCKNGRLRIATFEQIDSEDPPDWYSDCSERWCISDQVTHWRYPRFPEPESA